jgi:hypothetical protein
MRLLRHTLLLVIALATFTHFASAQKRYKIDGFRLSFDKNWKKMKNRKFGLENTKTGAKVVVKQFFADVAIDNHQSKNAIFTTLNNLTKRLTRYPEGKNPYLDIWKGMEFEKIKIDGVDALMGRYIGKAYDVREKPTESLVAYVFAFKNRKGKLYHIFVYELARKKVHATYMGNLTYAINSIKKWTKIKK